MPYSKLIHISKTFGQVYCRFLSLLICITLHMNTSIRFFLEPALLLTLTVLLISKNKNYFYSLQNHYRVLLESSVNWKAWWVNVPCKMYVQVTWTLIMPNHLLQHQTTYWKEIISSPYFHVPTVYFVKQVIRKSQNGGNKPCTKLGIFFLK